MGITPEDIQAQRELLERGERIIKANEQQAERARLRDTFAAAALTGFIRGIPDNSVFHLGLIAKQAYEVADAMIRERARSCEQNDEKRCNSNTGRVALTDAERESLEAVLDDPDLVLGDAREPLRLLLERLK